MTFDDPSCMSDSSLGLDVNKIMINNMITRKYSHSDVKFMTRVGDMRSGSTLQVKGQCIQSETYPMIGVTVDYLIEKSSIKQVVHGSSAGGCKDS
jgi:hypothetical protein